MARNRRCHPSLGYTLLEILLALALTAVVLMIVTSGITVQLRAFSAGRARVERAQLARVLLHRMADDLRGALPPAKAESGTSATSTSATGDEATSEGTSETEGQPSGQENAGEEEEESETDSEDGSATTTATVAGIYGEADWLRVDVVRVPRVESGSTDSGSSTGSTSTGDTKQVKTIVYYAVTPEEATVDTLAADSGEQAAGGLVRRELTRPTAVWAAEQGSMQYCDTSVSPLASEVRAVEFRYHDGTDWVESWDTETSETLPKAIEIRLYLAPLPMPTLGPRQTAVDTTAEDEAAEMQYRLVVPMALEGGAGSTGGMGSGDTSSQAEGETGEETSPADASGQTGTGNESDQQGGTP